MTVKSSGLSAMGASVDAPSETIRAMVAEVAEVEDAGMDVTAVRSGATSLVRTAGKTSLARAHGGISLVRTALRSTPGFLHYRRRQEGTTTTIKTRGWGLPGTARYRLHLGWCSGPSLRASSSSLLVR